MRATRNPRSAPTPLPSPRNLLRTVPRRMGGRAVEGTGLENRQTRKGLVGSNPTPSAIVPRLPSCAEFVLL